MELDVLDTCPTESFTGFLKRNFSGLMDEYLSFVMEKMCNS
jgi:hypothetical protein